MIPHEGERGGEDDGEGEEPSGPLRNASSYLRLLIQLRDPLYPDETVSVDSILRELPVRAGSAQVDLPSDSVALPPADRCLCSGVEVDLEHVHDDASGDRGVDPKREASAAGGYGEEEGKDGGGEGGARAGVRASAEAARSCSSASGCWRVGWVRSSSIRSVVAIRRDHVRATGRFSSRPEVPRDFRTGLVGPRAASLDIASMETSGMPLTKRTRSVRRLQWGGPIPVSFNPRTASFECG